MGRKKEISSKEWFVSGKVTFPIRGGWKRSIRWFTPLVLTSDSRLTVSLLEEAETAVTFGIKSWLAYVGLSKSDFIWACCLLFNKGKNPFIFGFMPHFVNLELNMLVCKEPGIYNVSKYNNYLPVEIWPLEKKELGARVLCDSWGAQCPLLSSDARCPTLSFSEFCLFCLALLQGWGKINILH